MTALNGGVGLKIAGFIVDFFPHFWTTLGRLKNGQSKPLAKQKY
jgi:hypothetical protein